MTTLANAAPIATAWPADSVERWPIEDLVPYANNARLHSDEQVSQIVESIRRFGFTVPILVAEDGTIIAGHGRILAAKQLDIAEVPVVVAKGWSESQRRAYTLVDNKLAENSSWDDDLLKLELGELLADDVEVIGLGFSQSEIDVIFNGWAPDPDKVDVQAEMTDLEAVIKVRCSKQMSDEVVSILREAINEAGLSGVTVE